MKHSSLHPSALRVAAEIDADNDPVKRFVIAGGRLSFTSGTNVARLFGVTASCTAGEDCAVKAWVLAVQRKAAAA